MNELVEKTKKVLELADRGDFMTLISYVEAECRNLVESSDDNSNFTIIWKEQIAAMDKQDWMTCLNNQERLRDAVKELEA